MDIDFAINLSYIYSNNIILRFFLTKSKLYEVVFTYFDFFPNKIAFVKASYRNFITKTRR